MVALPGGQNGTPVARHAHKRLSERARAFLDAHHRIEILMSEAGLSPPDLVIHDFNSAELRAVWNDEDVVVVVERIGETASSHPRPRVTKPGQRKV
jgi:hypothetical protein